jgi:predicted kinase
LIIGWPGTGKTTLAKDLAETHQLEHLCTDPQRLCPPGVKGTPDGLNWSGCSQFVADNWLGNHSSVIEGVAVLRALRKWREKWAKNPNVPFPADKIILLKNPLKPLSKGQITMGKGHDTVLTELLPWIKDLLEEP